MAAQQRLLKFILQQPHLSTQRRLGNAQQHRSASEASGLCNLDEVLDLAQVHAPEYTYSKNE